jgi:hypothetical protein
MEKGDKLCFVQFIHPGKEHSPNNADIKNWNNMIPKRKFLQSKGRYISDNRIEEGNILFWGEWEPESRVIKKIDKPIPNGPRYIYEPYYRIPKSYHGLKDTDPFVFGNPFYYTACQQYAKKNPTQLRNLSRGSVILFGSCVNQNFVLDTVFVVNDWINHNKNNYKNVLKGKISEVYADVTLSPLYQELSAESKSYRLYFGATFYSPLKGMFSFFPCLPCDDNPKGFARPIIKIKNIITNDLRQGRKITVMKNIDEVTILWNNVVKQVTKKGLKLGIFAQLPEMKRMQT